MRDGAVAADALKVEYDFVKYVELLDKVSKEYIIIIAARDTPWGPAFTQEKAEVLRKIGLKANLFGMFRRAYVALIDSGNVIFEKVGDTTREVIAYESAISGDSVSVYSSSFEADVIHSFTAGSVMINGEELSTRGRGLNIVVYDKIAKKVLDTVNFDTYSADLSCRHPFGEIDRLRSFQKNHPAIRVVCVDAPKFPTENLTQNERFILKNNVIRETIINNLDKPVFAINQYYSREILEEVFRVPKSYHDVRGIRRFEDTRGKYVNTVGGHRVTAYQPQQYEQTIWFVGGCSVFGIGAIDEHTMASLLQGIINERAKEKRICVQNYGYFLCEADRQREEEVSILESLPIRDGDVVLYYRADNGISLGQEFPCIDCSKIALQPRKFEVFSDKGHLTPDGYRLVAEKIFNELSARKLLGVPDRTSPWISSCASEYGFDSNQSTELAEYKRILTNFYNEVLSVTIGAIVMNCNPFTLGHRYLIEQALQQCNFLIVFLVEEDSSFFSFEDRLRLIDEGTADLDNVAIIPSGRFIISSLTFEEYFNKSELQERVIDTSKDITVFAREIAPCLHITKRFAGEEPLDKVTMQYNEAMKRILPEYGIEFIEIPRKKEGEEVISASRVRTLLEEGDFERIKYLVPETTFRYLVERYKEE